MSWVEIVVVVLVLLTALHTLLTVALIRRVALIAGGQQLANAGPAIASALGPVAGEALDGQQHDGIGLSDALVAVLSNQCDECRAAAATLTEAIDSGHAGQRAVVLVVAPDGIPPDYAAGLADRAEVYLLRENGHPFLADNSIRIFPYFLRTDDRAIVRAAGPVLADALRPAPAHPAG